jgi:hypothetical protein
MKRSTSDCRDHRVNHFARRDLAVTGLRRDRIYQFLLVHYDFPFVVIDGVTLPDRRTNAQWLHCPRLVRRFRAGPSASQQVKK